MVELKQVRQALSAFDSFELMELWSAKLPVLTPPIYQGS